MRHARQRCTALLVCLVFASLELLSAAPGLHRHNDGADGFLHHPAAAAASPIPSGPALALPGAPRDQAPRECPACRLSGLFAVASCGIPVAVPAPRLRHSFIAGVRAVASPVVASLRGRAPPRA